ncbi:hypothetical protein [Thermodesulfatator atlanticus]|uniref:hypothetical protein n=1 Tax=Thermodesulfatator atlanticus TaxID=501497 RepID=UPI0003B5D5A8|nr:hypothetical protein [Thermodesulfatator atlanticus]
MRRLFFLLVFLFVVVPFVNAQPTKIVVRVKAKDAKFIGSSLGGVLVIIRDARTGKILAQGKTVGTTGNTKLIMKTPHPRGVPISDAKSAKFEAVIDINEPTKIEVTAYGPLAQPQAANKVSATQWVVPGKNIDQGDAFMLELPGMMVDVLDPPAHVKLKGTPQEIALRANVAMMCGCPIIPGGIWDANNFEVKAIIKRNGKVVDEIPLKYAGKPSQFAATYKATEKGVYEAIVYAYCPANGNTGVDFTTFIVK